MRFLALLLVVGVAYAHHTPEHKLKHPGFIVGKTHLYDVMFNMTSGVPGMDPQVSKSVIQAEVKIYAKKEKELIIMMHNVKVSHSLPGVGSTTDKIPLTPDPKLEEHLKEPIVATLENHMVKSYTLSKRETLESKKIKKSVLRNLELYLDGKILTGDSVAFLPLTYNLTRSSVGGNYTSHYVVTSSPYPAFPKESNVFNISRTDNFEVIPYLAYKSHHNFAKQGCPEVCKKDHTENIYGAGCPIEHEPYQTPLKRSFVQHHNLRMLKTSRTLIIDTVRTKETHVANVYDQDMEVTIRTFLKFKKATGETIPSPSSQDVYTDLNDLTKEINDEEIERICKYPDATSAIKEVKSLLDEITDIVDKADLKDEKSKEVGGLLVTLQKSLQMLKQGDLRTVQKSIVSYDELEEASAKDKIKRQIWLDLLPTIGSSESVSFIVDLISENMNLPNKVISLWESKTILESLPQNIHRPTEQTITDLSRLLEILTDRQTPGYTVFYSAAHLTVARVIRILCSVSTGIDESHDSHESGFRYLRRNVRDRNSDSNNEFKNNMARECPKTTVKKFIDQVSRELETTEDKSKRVIYIETLARTGLDTVLPALKPYVYGEHGLLRSSSKPLSKSYIDYLKTVAIYALHNIVDKSPRHVQDIILPVFFNKTEPPKVRTAAFSVVMKAQPTLGLLQHIAEQSWSEPSEEVGSFVISTLETFGNSSMPCHQLTALRIKKVLPQVKRVDHGHQKAKNYLWDLWDEIRTQGFEKHFQFTPSNESFIPSAIFGSMGYNADTLKDYIFQMGFNIQGLTSRTVYAHLKPFGFSPAEDIPKDHEKDIFPDLDIIPRDGEFWRFTAYEKFYYKSSFYYFDAEDTTHEDIVTMVIDQLKHYITRDSEGKYHGHLIKVLIPSSYHAKTISQSLPYPVEFHMKSPVLVSLKVKVEPTHEESGVGFHFHLSPSMYHSLIYTNEMLNLGDCKKVGVYHEQKVALTYPVVITVKVESNKKFSFSYRFPDLPKQVFTYRSEAGSYAGKHVFALLPPNEDRRTIKTLPSQFVKPISWGIIGLPRFHGSIKTEDIQSGMEETSRTPKEAFSTFVKRYLNSGWRRKSIDISRVPDEIIWRENTEVKIHVNMSRDFVTRKTSQTDWSKDLKFDDELHEGDIHIYASEGQKIYHKLSTTLSHIRDDLSITVEQIEKSHESKKLDLTLNYYHTLGGFLHYVHFNASAHVPRLYKDVSMTADYAIAFVRRPNEFKYTNEQYGKQKGLALGGISFSNFGPFHDPYIMAKAVFGYEPLYRVLRMDPPADPTHFEPQTAEMCMNDNTSGESDSVACLMAKREKSIYNKLKLHAVWAKELPYMVEELTDKLDLALKHAFYSHMEVSKKRIYKEPLSKKDTLKHLRIETTYIDKMTDEPVVDIVLDKPTEIVKFWRVSTGNIQPMSSIDSLPETYLAYWTNNTYPATCTMMDKYIRTFDLKSYPLPKDTPECSYVLSTHCIEHKKFAVIVKYSPTIPGTPEIHMHVGKDEIILVPGHKFSYELTYNGHKQTVMAMEPLMLSDTEMITALVNIANDGTSFIEVNARKAGIKIRYNGSNVKVQVHPRYKGELCGLCSEFNGEIVREYRGVDRCLYTSPFDFAKSSVLSSCLGENRQPDFPHMCNNDEVSYSWGKQRPHHESEEVEGHEPTLRRNAVSYQGSRICISIKPVPVCEGSSEPLKTESREVEYHCLPKQDVNARKLVTESRRRILSELETKSVDHSEVIDVATMC